MLSTQPCGLIHIKIASISSETKIVKYLLGMKGFNGDLNCGIHGLLTGFQGPGGGRGRFNPNGNLG